MSRRNIFEILSEDFDILKEIRTIWFLFKRDVTISIPKKGTYRTTSQEVSILDFVHSHAFTYWKSRNRSISPFDMMERLGINEESIFHIDKFCDELIVFLEFVLNMIKRCDIYLNNKDKIPSSNYKLLKENNNIFIEHFGYETFYDKDKEQVLLIEKNEVATAVAEISEPDITKKVIQYNHYKLKGDVEEKKNIILLLANELEPQRNELEKINQTIASDLFFMLNNMNLRHNNIEPDDKNFKKYVADMNKNELEEWYDETYQMILLAYLLLDNVERQKKIKGLKKLV